MGKINERLIELTEKFTKQLKDDDLFDYIQQQLINHNWPLDNELCPTLNQLKNMHTHSTTFISKCVKPDPEFFEPLHKGHLIDNGYQEKYLCKLDGRTYTVTVKTEF